MFFATYIGLGLIWSAASMGSALIAIEEHIKVKNMWFFSSSQTLTPYPSVLDF
jgi:hypothetical protein